MKIAILGLWHQGVVGAACLADMGHEIVGADSHADRVARLRDGKAPLFEPGLDKLLAKGLASGRLSFSTGYAESVRNADFVYVMFDTTVDEADESDLTEVFSTFEAIAQALTPNTPILVTAQVPVGTCDELARTLVRAAPNCSPTIAYMPENLRLGQAIARFMQPALPVIGCNDSAAIDRLLLVLGPLSAEWHRVSLRTAEMMKHALNSFLAVSVCFANELGNLCDAVGADGKRIGELLRLEPRVGSKAMLLPGLGFSGGTLARDMQTLRALGRDLKIATPLLDGAWTANALQNRVVLEKLTRATSNLQGARIAVLGLTYKPDTSTLRRSASIELIEGLASAGALVSAHDPRADRDELKRLCNFTVCDEPLETVVGAEALVLMTPWKDYRELDFQAVRQRMAKPYILDTAGLWDGNRLTHLGFIYDDIGRGRRPSDS